MEIQLILIITTAIVIRLGVHPWISSLRLRPVYVPVANNRP